MKRALVAVGVSLISINAFSGEHIQLDANVKDKLCAYSAGSEVAKILSEKQAQPAITPIRVSEKSTGILYEVKTSNTEDGEVLFEVQTYNMYEEDGTCAIVHYREVRK